MRNCQLVTLQARGTTVVIILSESRKADKQTNKTKITYKPIKDLRRKDYEHYHKKQLVPNNDERLLL